MYLRAITMYLRAILGCFYVPEGNYYVPEGQFYFKKTSKTPINKGIQKTAKTTRYYKIL